MTKDHFRSVTEATRRKIFDALSIEDFPWWGRLTETHFLGRLFDLKSLPSTDPRHDTADEDIERHRVWNNDWRSDWIYYDNRFDLTHCPDDLFFEFLTEMAHPVIQIESEKVEWLVDVFNEYLPADGWWIAKRGEIAGRPTFCAVRHTRASPDETDLQAIDRSQDPAQSETEGILATLTDLCAHEGLPREVAILANADAVLKQTNHESWNGGTYGFTLYLRLPTGLYTQIYAERENLQDSIWDKGKPLFADNEYLQAVSILPVQKADPQWRERAKAWLAGTGVTNQGRVRSDNIASRECDGLLFRSQPEINLYKALKAVGVSFAPLPVFIRGGQNYRRIEPDFVVVKDGVVMVVEVDGDTVHRELPAEAHDRTTILEYEGARVVRVLASKVETPDLASHYARELLTVIERLKRSQH